MKTTAKKISAKVMPRGGKHMGHTGKPAKIPVSHNMKSANKAKKFPC